VEDYRAKLEAELQANLETQESEMSQELVELNEQLQSTNIQLDEDFDKLPHSYVRFIADVTFPCFEFSIINEFEQQIIDSKI